jgi:hypothetical protein
VKPRGEALDWSDEELSALAEITPADIEAAKVYGRTVPPKGAGGLDDPGALADATPAEESEG